MKENRQRVIFDVTVSVLSLIIVILTVIVLASTLEHTRLLPLIFLTGSCLTGVVAVRESGRRSSMTIPICCFLAGLCLLFLAIRGFVMYWAKI